jgi:hypothetical protein
MKHANFSLIVLVAFPFALNGGCGGTTTGNPPSTSLEDSSASGAAAEAAGGALSGSGQNATQAFVGQAIHRSAADRLFAELSAVPNATAASACPTFKTSEGSGCHASGDAMWLTYSDCSFGASGATWSGVQGIFDSAGSASCKHFPYPSFPGSLVRQFVAASGSSSPGNASLTSAFGTVTQVNHAVSNIGNFNGDAVAPILNGGYGSQVTFDGSGARTSVVLAEEVVTPTSDHSIDGTLTVAETASASTRTLTGHVTVYHNLLKVIGTATFNNVTHTDGCCLPTSGSISTVFAASSTGGPAPTTAGQKYVGQTETLTFTGCGSATLAATDGTTTDVTLSRCF